MASLCEIRLNGASEMFDCWEQWWIDVDGASHTLSATAAIFSGIRTVFGLSRFGLSMRMTVSFTFFSQDNEYTELTGGSLLPKSVRNFTTHSVAIFLSVVQVYTQPYSFGGRVKLVICQIRHELSVAIHEISTRRAIATLTTLYIELAVCGNRILRVPRYRRAIATSTPLYIELALYENRVLRVPH